MVRRYLGYGITNASGVATLDHDPSGSTLSHSYTGVGAGKIDIVATTEDGDIESDPYGLMDAKLISDMNCYVIRVTKTTNSDGSVTLTLTEGATSNNGQYKFSSSTTSSSVIFAPQGSVFELDIVEVSNNATVTFRLDSADTVTNIISSDASNFRTGHYKFINDGSTLQAVCDGTVIATVTGVESTSRAFVIRINSAESSVRINNLLYY